MTGVANRTHDCPEALWLAVRPVRSVSHRSSPMHPDYGIPLSLYVLVDWVELVECSCLVLQPHLCQLHERQEGRRSERDKIGKLAVLNIIGMMFGGLSRFGNFVLATKNQIAKLGVFGVALKNSLHCHFYIR